ncbi:MAG: hypothetical protein AAGH64_00155 [Planctomycetota bacterium]
MHRHPDPMTILLMGWLETAWLWGPLALAVVFFYFACWGDRPRGRLRCRKCWHDMSGVPRRSGGWVCPECATPATRERQLRRVRPIRWVQATYLVFLLLAPVPWYTGVVVERWPDEGKAALVPRALVALAYPSHVRALRTPGSFGARVDAVLDERSCPNGDCADLHPVYRWLAGTPEYDYAWFDPMDYIDVPRAWVKDEPIPVDLDRVTHHLWTQPDYRQRVTVMGRGAFAFGVDIHPGWGAPGTGYTHTFPHREPTRLTLPASDSDSALHKATVTLDVRPPQMAHGLDYARTTRRAVTIDVPLVDTWEEALNGGVQSPVRDPAIDAWLLSTPQVLFTQVDGYIFLHGPDRAVRAYGPKAVPFHVNLVYDVVLLDEGDELHRGTVGQASRFWDFWESPSDNLGLKILGASEEEFQRNLDRMTVRPVPRPRLALTQFAHDTYWLPADGVAYLEMTLREAAAAAPVQGAGVATIDLLNPPVPFVRTLPW